MRLKMKDWSRQKERKILCIQTFKSFKLKGENLLGRGRGFWKNSN